MSDNRFVALRQAYNNKPVEEENSKNAPFCDFGKYVFDVAKMGSYLSRKTFENIKERIDVRLAHRKPIDQATAEEIASAMKTWAMENGATHYTHWFQPLTDATAEKHDAFLDFDKEGNVLERFSGKTLVQQEPDASSFPNGGIRDTFEARGYTAWDISSPAFIIGHTLCVPTIFFSYTGESLDYKTPLLRSIDLINKAAVDVCRYFDESVTHVTTNLGWEQEYFLIDEALYYARPDLVLTNRTLLGHASAKSQQFDDHYFASIPARVKAYMRDLERSAYELGIPLKTRHNEVAPNQFECAPIFSDANLANDHNQLLMDIMKRVASKHRFKVLFHEKPFKGINGSGKHNNWSLTTNTGVNLFSPAKKGDEQANLQFLVFIVTTLKAVYENQDLLRASILNYSNSYRLGAQEAPPAIISVFLGTHISRILDNLLQSKDLDILEEEVQEVRLGIEEIPELSLDNTDRNRTSPFAFTGNRFEFRAPGSSCNCASPITAINSIMAHQLIEFKKEVDAQISSKQSTKQSIVSVLKRYIKDTVAIRFNGDGYSNEWVIEAKKRGLTNIKGVPESLKQYLSDKAKKVLIQNGIFTQVELEGRVEVELEKYVMNIQTEARVLRDLSGNHVLPVAIKYQTLLMENIAVAKTSFGENYSDFTGPVESMAKEIGGHISSVNSLIKELESIIQEVEDMPMGFDKAYKYSKEIRPFLEKIRLHTDKLERIVDDSMWPLPKYRELLFIR